MWSSCPPRSSNVTLRELGRLAATSIRPPARRKRNHADRWRALVPLAARRRGLISYRPTDDDVVDP